MLAASRPGYVYLLANPSLPGWHKVGHTHRPPHRRAAELSRTALPTAFEVAFARFFWDAPSAERHVHQVLQAQATAPRRKEFFLVDPGQATRIIQAVEDAGRHGPAPSSREDPAWEDTLEGREELWSWAEADLRSPSPATRRAGWRAMEALSASGWAEGSWRLADLMMRRDPTLDGALRAAWVLDAARIQGMPEAGLRAAWLRSWEGTEAFVAWRGALAQAVERYGMDPWDWPGRALETLRAEVESWERLPARRVPGDFSAFLAA